MNLRQGSPFSCFADLPQHQSMHMCTEIHSFCSYVVSITGMWLHPVSKLALAALERK